MPELFGGQVLPHRPAKKPRGENGAEALPIFPGPPSVDGVVWPDGRRNHHEDQPHPSVKKTYGAKVEYANPPDEAPALDKAGKKFIQEVTGVFLFLNIDGKKCKQNSTVN